MFGESAGQGRVLRESGMLCAADVLTGRAGGFTLPVAALEHALMHCMRVPRGQSVSCMQRQLARPF